MLIGRRKLFRWAAFFAGFFRISSLHSWAQTQHFPAGQEEALQALAAVVLPSELGSEGAVKVAEAFVQWVRGYRAGAEMDHGYGFTRIRSKPSLPVLAYAAQLRRLQKALLTGSADSRAAAVIAALEAAKITGLLRTPDGRHIASDLMAFYFRSSDANDLCYRAAIGRDLWRGLESSEAAPAALKGRA